MLLRHARLHLAVLLHRCPPRAAASEPVTEDLHALPVVIKIFAFQLGATICLATSPDLFTDSAGAAAVPRLP